MNTTNYPVKPDLSFSEYQINTAKVIDKGISEKNLEKLRKVIRSIPRADFWPVIYAYYNLYGCSYSSKIQSMDKSTEELNSYGFA